MPLTTVATTIEPEQAGRLDVVIRHLVGTSHSQVRGMIESGCVQVNEETCEDIGWAVSIGDQVSLRYDPNQRYREKKKKRLDDRTFTIVYEDESLIVVDKAAGTLTVPTDHHEKNTLVDRVSLYLSHSKRRREAYVIHRLDREVSGLLVMGKDQAIADQLIEQFKQRKPDRVYTAIVAGLIDEDEGTFESYLATGKNLDRYVTGPSKHSERAVTHFRVVRRMEDTTQVEARLETGKRNQIRVHFAHAGHPVLGDPRYEPEKASHPRWIRKRIALHAISLGFQHPATGEAMTMTSKLPAAMQKFLAGGVGRQME